MEFSLYELRNENFSNILEEIHKKMEERIKRKKNDDRAQIIEDCLRQVKKTAVQLSEKKSNSNIVNTIQTEMSELIQDTFNQQLTLRSNLRKKDKLFRRRHDSLKNAKTTITDDIFEQELAALITAAAKKRGVTFNISTVTSGAGSASVQALEKIPKTIQTKLLEITNDAVEKEAKRLESKFQKIVQFQADKSGKVDISVPKITISGDANNLIDKFLNAISGANFTLKNYSSKNESLSKINIHLGESNYYKAITGALSSIFPDPHQQRRVYWRGITILAGKSKSPDSATKDLVSTHFGHLRFIYELQGTGLIDAETNKKIQADFIIWNDPNSERIVVRSVASLIQQYWEKYTKPFRDVSISASRISRKKTN